LAVDLVIGTVVGRWYVTIFGLTFLWRASRHLGWRKLGIYVAVALVVGALAENGSVHLGLPYTRYAFNESLRDDELFLFDVPLMVPLSYTFMAYFALLLGPADRLRPVPHACASRLARAPHGVDARRVGAVDPRSREPARRSLLPR
jgi:uncharacterized membrane protein